LSEGDVSELLQDQEFVTELEHAMYRGVQEQFIREQERDDEFRRSREKVRPIGPTKKRRLIRDEDDKVVSAVWVVDGDLVHGHLWEVNIRQGGLAYCRRRRPDIFDPPFRFIKPRPCIPQRVIMTADSPRRFASGLNLPRPA